MEYNGWKLMNSVNIVTRDADIGTQGYLVDPKNKNQLRSALDWAGSRHSGTVEFENTGFKIKFKYAADKSYVTNGKLSFWNCEISKGEFKCIIGINSDLLLELIMGSTIINGEVQEGVFFATKSGNTGVIHKGLPAYKEALNDVEIKKKYTSGKTSNWEIGRAYSTLSVSSIYVANVYDWIEEIPDIQCKDQYGIDIVKKAFRIREKPVIARLTINTQAVQYFMRDKENMDLITALKAVGNGYSVYNICLKKLPSRVPDDYTIKIGDSHEIAEFFVERDNKSAEHRLKTSSFLTTWVLDLINYVRYTADATMTDNQKQLLERISHINGRDVVIVKD